MPDNFFEDDNSSGLGAGALLPVGLPRWNWGAFLLTWIWGIGNNVFIAFLMFVPIVNLVMWFVLGFKGSEWAWRHKRWDSLDHFLSVQRRWAKWGLVFYVALLIVVAALIGSIFAILKSSEAYKMSVQALEQDARVAELLGTPLSSGYPTGGVQVVNGEGSAHLSYSVSGPKGSGTAYVDAIEQRSQWHLEHLEVAPEGRETRLLIVP